VHFDLPEDDKTYLHRSGRTARAGNTGTVVSLVGNDQLKELRAMQRLLGMEAGVTVPALTELDGRPTTKVASQGTQASRSRRARGSNDTRRSSRRRKVRR
jgi:ATP-dependent RNA helicase RhlE